jgi:hypothetical protein
MPNSKPWNIQLALFARRSFTPPVFTAAKEDGTVLVTFEQMVSDLASTPPRAIR